MTCRDPASRLLARDQPGNPRPGCPTWHCWEIFRSRMCRGMWHNLCMARGWESKDVESQVAGKETMAAPGKAKKAPDQLEKDRERGNLELSRKHILNDLESATHPNHKKSLEAALAHLDQKLEELK